MSQLTAARERSSTYIGAHIQGLGYPIGRDTVPASGFDTVVIQGRGATVGVNIACESGRVVRVSNEEDSLDGGEGCTGELGQCCNSGCGSLAVALEDKAGVGAGLEGVLDLSDDLAKSVKS